MPTMTRTWHEDIIDAALADFPRKGNAHVAVALLNDGTYLTSGRWYLHLPAARGVATRLSRGHDDCNAYTVTRGMATRGPVYVVRCENNVLHARLP